MPSVSEESFRLIVETIPGLIAVMTPAGEVEHVNRQVVEYFGRTLDELKRWDYRPSSLTRGIRPSAYARDTRTRSARVSPTNGPCATIGTFCRSPA
jgi:PAS domain-containing protein